MDGEHTFKVAIYGDEIGINAPIYAKVNFNKALRDKIRRLMVIAEVCSCCQIETFDSHITWLNENKEENGDIYIETVTLNVLSNSFDWRGKIKNTNIEVGAGDLFNPEEKNFFQEGDITRAEAIEEACKDLLRLDGDNKFQNAVTLASIGEEVRSE